MAQISEDGDLHRESLFTLGIIPQTLAFVISYNMLHW